MERLEISVEGMTCGGCVNGIQRSLLSHEGVISASADLDSSIVSIEFDSEVIEQDTIKQAIITAGLIING